MEANIKLGAACTIKVTGETPVDLIKAVAQFSQLPTSCGKCDSKNLAFRHRTAGQSNEYHYLTLQCNDCGAAMDIGQQKTGGGIFPTFKPKDKKGVVNGFYHWKDQDYAQQDGGGGGASQQNHPPQNNGTPTGAGGNYDEPF